MSEAGFIDDSPPRRRGETFAPLAVWRRTLLLTLLAVVGGGAFAAFVRTPMPVAVDAPLYAAQLDKLDAQAEAVRKAGGEPLSVVFLGTSRLRNVALDAAGIAEQARLAGVTRPVVSTVLGVNWGGFERFAPALPMIHARKPDVVVVMPELLADDFTPSARAGVAKTWVQSALWGNDFSPFAVAETTTLVCMGFAKSPAERDKEASEMIGPNPAGRGPKLARSFLRRLAAGGTRIVIAEVPVTRQLAALRTPLAQGQALLDRHGIGDLPGARAVVFGARFDRSAYCDVAHFDPARDHLWQAAFFTQVAPVLNAL